MSGPLLLALAAPACLATTEPVAAGGIIDQANTGPASCQATAERKLRYDTHARVVRARMALAAGEPIGRVALRSRPAVISGDRVTVAVHVGPVTVAREAVALQSAAAGRRFFVRGDDGVIFTAPAMAEEQR